ncbi:pantetheine-phosphate adenylyltransferase [Ruania halotolerans]|uniref:pantetheine-phosphate adenylyltransferase n=1 Tax=Ruania halotolerans TaxID=2897773 RepID=UPI001E3B10C4|nr:pantetheine-phosphate adenylyltransferase [Ruania halotolerans]UFU07844.1 pantetheine-phosphate adenylyltransferase [Ruania halotolerans]
MTSRIAVCPGSYDPVTLGHLDIVRRARTLFEEVVVAVGINATKAALLDADERVHLFTEAVANLEGVRVVRMPGLLADLCAELGAHAIVKGLRGGADYDAEQPMALMNRHLSGVETVFVTGAPELAHVSSSMVKDVARYGGDITDLVPPAVSDAVYAALAPQMKDGSR